MEAILDLGADIAELSPDRSPPSLGASRIEARLEGIERGMDVAAHGLEQIRSEHVGRARHAQWLVHGLTYRMRRLLGSHDAFHAGIVPRLQGNIDIVIFQSAAFLELGYELKTLVHESKTALERLFDLMAPGFAESDDGRPRLLEEFAQGRSNWGLHQQLMEQPDIDYLLQVDSYLRMGWPFRVGGSFIAIRKGSEIAKLFETERLRLDSQSLFSVVFSRPPGEAVRLAVLLPDAIFEKEIARDGRARPVRVAPEKLRRFEHTSEVGLLEQSLKWVLLAGECLKEVLVELRELTTPQLEWEWER